MLRLARSSLILFTTLCSASVREHKLRSLATLINPRRMSGTTDADPLVGETLPDNILDEKLLKGTKDEVTLRSILAGLPEGQKGIVIFLFPAVNTPYCTKQACKYNTANKQFTQLGYDVFGLTKASGKSADDWAKANSLSYPILQDKRWTLIKYLKCTWLYYLVVRTHLIVGRNGKILAIERGVDASKSSSRVLELIKTLEQN